MDVPAPALLAHLDGLPLEAPFTAAHARKAGVTRDRLARLLERGLVRRVLRGVFVAAQVPDSLELRCRVMQLVIPEGAVVTDTTAAWLLGAEMILAPGAHLHLEPVSYFHRTPGNRSRAGVCWSGERTMPDADVMHVQGIAVTTPLRTALDLGRLLSRPRAFAALDSMLRLRAFELDDLLVEIGRFKGYRGVRQLRALAPLADARAQSPGESALRLHWLDCSDLPRPELQVPVPGPSGAPYYLDLGLEELRFAAEYDGEEWHGPDRADHDAGRREWMTRREGWIIEVMLRQHVFGRRQDAFARLRAGIRQARRTVAERRRLR